MLFTSHFRKQEVWKKLILSRSSPSTSGYKWYTYNKQGISTLGLSCLQRYQHNVPKQTMVARFFYQQQHASFNIYNTRMASKPVLMCLGTPPPPAYARPVGTRSPCLIQSTSKKKIHEYSICGQNCFVLCGLVSA